MSEQAHQAALTTFADSSVRSAAPIASPHIKPIAELNAAQIKAINFDLILSASIKYAKATMKVPAINRTLKMTQVIVIQCTLIFLSEIEIKRRV
jgi:hypothetical protein